MTSKSFSVLDTSKLKEIKLDYGTWTAFNRNFPLYTIAFGDAHDYYLHGKLPSIRLPQRDDLILTPSSAQLEDIEFEPELYVPAQTSISQSSASAAAMAEEKPVKEEDDNSTIFTMRQAASAPAASAVTLPAGVRSRYPDGKVGDTLFAHDFNRAMDRREKYRESKKTLLTLMMSSLSPKLYTAITNHSRYIELRSSFDVRQLWQLLKQESSGFEQQATKANKYRNLLRASQGNDEYEVYRQRFNDAVYDLTSDAVVLDPALTTTCFLDGLNTDQFKAWFDSNYGKPHDSLDALQQELKVWLLSKQHHEEVRGISACKGARINNAVGALQTSTTVGQRSSKKTGKSGNQTNASKTNDGQQKEKRVCWNCGKSHSGKCNSKRAHCDKCDADKGHLTAFHDEWSKRYGDKGKKEEKDKNSNAATQQQPSTPGSLTLQPQYHPNAHYMLMQPSPYPYAPDTDGTKLTANITIITSSLQAHGVCTVSSAGSSRGTNTKFILDTGCTGASLVTTPDAFAALKDVKDDTSATIRCFMGEQTSTHFGLLPLAGPAFYTPTNTVNLISTSQLTRAGFLVQLQGDCLTVRSGDNNTELLRAQCDQEGHHVVTLAQLEKADRMLHSVTANMSRTTSTSMHRQLTSIPLRLSHSDLLKAQKAHSLHRQGHPSDEGLARALDSGCYEGGSELSSKDLRNARMLYGPCLACFEGKATVPREVEKTLGQQSFGIGEFLHVDLISLTATTIGGNTTGLIAADHATKYVTIAALENKGKQQCLAGIKSMIHFYNSYGWKVRYVSSDSENNLLSCSSSLASYGVQLHPTVPGLHEKLIERVIRELKEKAAATLADLPYVLPLSLYGELYSYICERMNSVPNVHTGHHTPYELVTGSKPPIINYAFGQPGLFHTDSDGLRRADFGIIVGFTYDAHSKWRVYFPASGAVRKCGSFQAVDYIPTEWNWPPRITAGRPPNQLHSAQPYSTPVNRHIQTGVPLSAAPIPSPAPSRIEGPSQQQPHLSTTTLSDPPPSAAILATSSSPALSDPLRILTSLPPHLPLPSYPLPLQLLLLLLL